MEVNMIETGDACPHAALGDALPALRADLRLDGDVADGELERCLRAAAGLCEAFTGLALIEREVVERLGCDGRWSALTRRPVGAITGVTAADGAALGTGDYGMDIGADGTGLVRGPGMLRVTYRAGLGADWASVPEALALGVVRLAGHLWTHRDGTEGKPPAAVAALWAPWRQLTLAAPAMVRS